MDYLVYTTGAITIGWLGYTVTHNSIRKIRKFWRDQIKTRALFRNTIGRLFLSEDERQRDRQDRDQQHIDELLQNARESRDRLLALTQWFADYTRTTQALDALPGRTSRRLVDELAKVEQDIAQSLTMFQRNLKSAIAAYTHGSNLLERFEAQQDSKATAQANTQRQPSQQVIIEATGAESLSDAVVYMVYYPATNATTQMTGAQIKQELARGMRINQDIFVCGPAANFARR